MASGLLLKAPIYENKKMTLSESRNIPDQKYLKNEEQVYYVLLSIKIMEGFYSFTNLNHKYDINHLHECNYFYICILRKQYCYWEKAVKQWWKLHYRKLA